MEERNIIYIDMLENKEDDNFVNVLENKFKENEYIVYRSANIQSEELIEEVNKIKPDVYVSLNVLNNNDEGIHIYTNNEYSLGNDIANKIYNQTKLLYNNLNNEKDVYYTNNIKELSEIKIPTVYVELKCAEENQENVINALYTGIDNYFKNRD